MIEFKFFLKSFNKLIENICLNLILKINIEYNLNIKSVKFLVWKLM